MLCEQNKRFLTAKIKMYLGFLQHHKTSLCLNKAGKQYILCLIIFNDLRAKIRHTKISTKNLFSKDERKVIFHFSYSKHTLLEKQKIAYSLLRGKCFYDSEAANELYLLEMHDRVKKKSQKTAPKMLALPILCVHTGFPNWKVTHPS